jgi:NADH-quinone oxidoreductase subunit J
MSSVAHLDSALLAATVLQPVAIILLCAFAAIGTYLLLPQGREAPIRKLGGTILIIAGVLFGTILVRAAAGEARGQIGVYFWIFALVAIGGAIRVVTHQRPVYSALYFILTVFASAGLFVLLAADFLAAALVIIYAGAILVTYVFVIMLASEASPGGKDALATQMQDYDAVSREPMVASIVGFALMALVLFVIFDKVEQFPKGAPAAESTWSSTQLIGIQLFTDHVVSLQLAGLLLTLSMIGAIVIARRRIVGQRVSVEAVLGPATPGDDNPHSIPVYGTDNPRQKEYPET